MPGSPQTKTFQTIALLASYNLVSLSLFKTVRILGRFVVANDRCIYIYIAQQEAQRGSLSVTLETRGIS
jgi:hypothetical protein